jgi:hypothetical protein
MRKLIPMRRALADPRYFGKQIEGDSWRLWRILASRSSRMSWQNSVSSPIALQRRLSPSGMRPPRR